MLFGWQWSHFSTWRAFQPKCARKTEQARSVHRLPLCSQNVCVCSPLWSSLFHAYATSGLPLGPTQTKLPWKTSLAVWSDIAKTSAVISCGVTPGRQSALQRVNQRFESSLTLRLQLPILQLNVIISSECSFQETSYSQTRLEKRHQENMCGWLSIQKRWKFCCVDHSWGQLLHNTKTCCLLWTLTGDFTHKVLNEVNSSEKTHRNFGFWF